MTKISEELEGVITQEKFGYYATITWAGRRRLYEMNLAIKNFSIECASFALSIAKVLLKLYNACFCLNM